MATEKLISLADASRLYKVSRRTIERLVKRGDLPYHRVGKQIRLLPSDIKSATYRHNSATDTDNGSEPEAIESTGRAGLGRGQAKPQ